MPDPIAFIDLAAQRRHLGRAVDEAILRVLEHGLYVMGPEVARLEADLAAFCGARHSISCANGVRACRTVRPLRLLTTSPALRSTVTCSLTEAVETPTEDGP